MAGFYVHPGTNTVKSRAGLVGYVLNPLPILIPAQSQDTDTISPWTLLVSVVPRRQEMWRGFELGRSSLSQLELVLPSRFFVY